MPGGAAPIEATPLPLDPHWAFARYWGAAVTLQRSLSRHDPKRDIAGHIAHSGLGRTTMRFKLLWHVEAAHLFVGKSARRILVGERSFTTTTSPRQTSS